MGHCQRQTVGNSRKKLVLTGKQEEECSDDAEEDPTQSVHTEEPAIPSPAAASQCLHGFWSHLALIWQKVPCKELRKKLIP